MPKINVLPREIAELIAAGEVVERPASVIKEMLENAIDAKADKITVEIQRGGITYMRVTDNGCGISHDDVPLAFLRHATSKIKDGVDLDCIATLGFRGEALAAVSSVARVEMLTKTADSEFGTHYIIEGGKQLLYDEAGCPDGTTVIVRDIFYNTPARMKFLKKDVSEANAVSSVVDRIALSHPEISFKFIRDGKQLLSTSGDGELKSVVYSVLGRDFSQSLIGVSYEFEHISVEGLTCKPVACRPTRNNQFVFLNGRLVRSGTVTAAAEQAYKNSAMIGKFPGFVLNIKVPFDVVDVNVHPAKTEVRFSDEHRIFSAVYSAVKNSLNTGDSRPAISISKHTFNPFERMTAEQFRQQNIDEAATAAERIYKQLPEIRKESFINKAPQGEMRLNDFEKPMFYGKPDDDGALTQEEPKRAETTAEPQKEDAGLKNRVSEEIPITLIGEAFGTYIIVQKENSIFLIDKHAAHERILFNKLKAEHTPQSQAMLTPVRVTLEKGEYDSVINNTDMLLKAGFEVEDFGNGSVLVRAVPPNLTGENIQLLIEEIAESISYTSSVHIGREDSLFHTVACKAAIKAGSVTSEIEMLNLAKKVLSSDDIMYCPHGRPVAFEIKRRELEKQFGRIQ